MENSKCPEDNICTAQDLIKSFLEFERTATPEQKLQKKIDSGRHWIRGYIRYRDLGDDHLRDRMVYKLFRFALENIREPKSETDKTEEFNNLCWKNIREVIEELNV